MTICLNPKQTEGMSAGVWWYTPPALPTRNGAFGKLICGCGQPTCRDYKEPKA